MELDERFASGRTVTVVLPPKADLGIDESVNILKDVLGRLGCGGCYSGIDIRLRHEISFLYDLERRELTGNFRG